MSDERKTTQEELHAPFESMPFATMMQKMMGRQWKSCDCSKMMSQIMAMCGGMQDEAEEEPIAETNQKA